MADGSGVPRLHPALKGDAVLAGDPGQLIRVVLEGPAKVLPADRPHFSNIMPSMGGVLSDDQIAGVLTYARQQFADNASAITPEQVAQVRAAVDATK
jgi:mono/diheme cytochrome c family protein